MKSFELLFPIKINVLLYEIIAFSGCAPINMLNSGRPLLPPILFNTNTFTPNDDFQRRTNIVQARPELKVYFDFPLPMNHIPRPPSEHHDHIMQQNYPSYPLQPHPVLNEYRSGFKNAPNSLQQPKYDEEKYYTTNTKEADSDDTYSEKEIETSTLEPFTSDYTTETTTDYETSTIDDDNLFLRSGVPDSVAASLLG